ncbi:putative MATE family efflux protein [Caldalkalibacillus uzonensis]|uniref:Probable multidrug resistance protein NorM n=1 Tax=Caldalkalibacillus uzonensis TaxID=353224 RepID=A0ABU0CTA0_9BACI|nr:MATE family efflux transporter [Caldalkalibacillus uzonensis]MDQ0339658.1 putative MATE family efflux protein [Caldalkalibacillus uzonensis]
MGKSLNQAEIEALEEGGSKAIRKKILQLAGPSLTEMVLLNVVQLINMMMVGRVGPEAVAAVGLTIQPVFLALAVFMALNVGTTAVIARAIGAGEYKEANLAAQQAFLLNTILSVIVISIMFPLSEQILVLMGAAPEVLVDGVLYAQIIFASLGFFSFSMGLAAILRGAGDTRTPMKVNVAANMLVILVGFPLIYGYFGFPALGVVGAAIATALARLAATVAFLLVLFGGKGDIRLVWSNLFRVVPQTMKRIIHVGLPAAGEQFVLRAGQIIFARVVAYLGTVAFAAHQICFTVLGMTFMPGMAFAVAATTLVGQGLGAQKPDLAERFGWETRKLGMIVSGSIGLCFILFAPYIMMAFTADGEVIKEGTNALRIIGAVQVAQSTQFILAGALRGAGDTKYPLYAMMVGVWGFRVVLCLVFVFLLEWGLAGAWLAVAVDQIIRSFLIIKRFKGGEWKTTQV